MRTFGMTMYSKTFLLSSRRQAHDNASVGWSERRRASASCDTGMAMLGFSGAHPNLRSRQGGFALMMALIFLLLISMLAIAASQHALLQERMAGSLRNAQQARMSAETALRGAEYKVWSTAGRPGTELQCLENAISPDGCVIYRSYGAPYKADGDVTRFQSAQGWIADIGIPYKGPAGRGYTNNPQYPTAKLAEDPRYIIEDLGSERPPGVGGLHESGSTGPNNGDQGGVHIYRITARATGGRTGVVSVVQSTFDAPASR